MAQNLQYSLDLTLEKVDKALTNLKKVVGGVKPAIKLDVDSEIAKGKIESLKQQIKNLENSKIDLKLQSDLIESKIKKVTKDLTSLKTLDSSPAIDLKIATAEINLKKLKNQLFAIGDKEVNIGINQQNIQRNISKIENDLQNSGQKAGNNFSSGLEKGLSRLSGIFDIAIGNTLANAVSSATSKAGDSIGKLFGDSINLEKTSTSLRVLIGDQEKSNNLLKELQKLGANTPFEFPEIAQTSKSLLSFGIPLEKNIKLVSQLSDITSLAGGDLSNFGELIAKISSTNILDSVDVSQLANYGITIKDLAGQIGLSAEEFGKLQKSGDLASKGLFKFKDLEAVFDNLTKKGGRFYEGSIEGSKTLGGLLSNVSDKIGIAFNKLIEIDGGEVKDGIFKTLRDTLAQTIGYLDTIDLTIIGQQANTFLLQLIDGIKQINFTQLSLDIQNIINLLIQFAPLILGVAGGFVAFNIITSVVATVTALTTAFTILGGVAGILGGALAFIFSPVTLIAIAIGSLIAIGVLLYQNWDYISQQASIIFTNIGNTFNQFYAKVQEVFNSVITTIKNTLSNIDSTIKSIDLGKIASEWGQNFVNGIKTKFTEAVDFIKNIFNNIKLPELKFPEIKLPEIPKFATGTSNFAGGLATFGERGRELLQFPSGLRALASSEQTSFLPPRTKIFTNAQTERMLRSESNNSVINNNQKNSNTVNNFSQSFNGFLKNNYQQGY